MTHEGFSTHICSPKIHRKCYSTYCLLRPVVSLGEPITLPIWCEYRVWRKMCRLGYLRFLISTTPRFKASPRLFQAEFPIITSRKQRSSSRVRLPPPLPPPSPFSLPCLYTLARVCKLVRRIAVS